MVPGCYFGRYDVRSPDTAAFQRGEFTVIDLNDLTSESTSIYDPHHGPLHGWRMLFRQWHAAWEISREIRAAGVRHLSATATMRLVPAPKPPLA